MDGDDAKGRERRTEERIPARIEIHFNERADAARVFHAYSLNFSAGGLCIRSQHKYPVGAELKLGMIIADQTFDLQGVVAWTRNGAVGIRFDHLSEPDRVRLTEIVELLRQG